MRVHKIRMAPARCSLILNYFMGIVKNYLCTFLWYLVGGVSSKKFPSFWKKIYHIISSNYSKIFRAQFQLILVNATLRTWHVIWVRDCLLWSIQNSNECRIQLISNEKSFIRNLILFALPVQMCIVGVVFDLWIAVANLNRKDHKYHHKCVSSHCMCNGLFFERTTVVDLVYHAHNHKYKLNESSFIK